MHIINFFKNVLVTTQGRRKQIIPLLSLTCHLVFYGCSHTNLWLIAKYIRTVPFLFKIQTSDHSREPSQGRWATHSLRFSTDLHSPRGETPWSSSRYEICMRRGRPAGRLQPLPRLIPLRLSALSRRAACDGVLGSSRRKCPKSEGRLLPKIWRTFESLVRRWTSTFVTNSCHWMPRMRRWHVKWNAWTRRLSSACNVQVSDS